MIKKKSGSILYISSSSALDGNEGRSAYSSAKAAMIAQAKVLSREVGIYNIRVNAIAPGLTNTDMMRKNTPEEILNEVISISSSACIPIKAVTLNSLVRTSPSSSMTRTSFTRIRSLVRVLGSLRLGPR